jgi:RNA polymerase sigma factor (sigma-70 family)
MHDVPDTPPAADRGHPVAVAYEVHREFLRVIAEQKFHVPTDDAGPLVNDVFVSYLRNHERVRDERAWLIAAICNAAREYWYHHGRRKGLVESASADAVTIDGIAERLDLAHVLARLPERCRKALWLRVVEGRSPDELAEFLATSVTNARQIVHRCKAYARALFEERRTRN